MPELPEVETVIRGLNDSLPGLKINEFSYIAKHLKKRDPNLKKIEGDSIENFSRRGKYILLNLKSGRKVVAHLRMSGRLLVKSNSDQRMKHEHLEITFNKSKKRLIFRDVRKFGTFELLDDKNAEKLESLGEDALTIKPNQLFKLMQASNRNIKAFLLDQTKIAGLGNIYVDESLYYAEIHPLEICRNIDLVKTQKLIRGIRKVLRQSIRNMGTTFDSFRTVEGKTGKQARNLLVYNQDGNKCRICGKEIEKIRVAGRGTHYCSGCQKLNRKR